MQVDIHVMLPCITAPTTCHGSVSVVDTTVPEGLTVDAVVYLVVLALIVPHQVFVFLEKIVTLQEGTCPPLPRALAPFRLRVLASPEIHWKMTGHRKLVGK